MSEKTNNKEVNVEQALVAEIEDNRSGDGSLSLAEDKKAVKASCWRGFVAIIVVVFIFAIAGFAASIFALYKQQSYNDMLQKSVNTNSSQVKTDPVVEALQNKINFQAQRLDDQAKIIKEIQNSQKLQQDKLDEAFKANQLNQVQLEQKVIQLRQSYLLPSSELSQQIQQMHKQAVIMNLNFSKQAWQILGSKAQALFFLHQAKALLMNVDVAARWMPSISGLILQVSNEPSIGESLLRVSFLQTLILKLQIQVPLSLTKNDGLNKASKSDNSVTQTSWQDALAASWQQIKSLIQVEKVTPQDQILLMQDAHVKALSELYSLLWQLKLTIIHNNAPMLAEVKKTFTRTVEQYFKADESAQKVIDIISGINVVATGKVNKEIDALISSLITSNQNRQLSPQSQIKGDHV